MTLQPPSTSPTGILPEELLYPRRLADVMLYLQRMPVTGDEKLSVFIGWARMVGVRVNSSQRIAVRNTGTDFAGPIAQAPAPGGAT